jgi:hypothetical protein
VDWKIESAICWVIEAAGGTIIDVLKSRIENHKFDTLKDLKALFAVNEGPGRLKADYLAHEEIAAVIREHEPCLDRAEILLETVTLACLERYNESEKLELDKELSTETCMVLRFRI